MWICCQLGAREHYSIPLALHRENQLARLITDAWADSWLPWKAIPGSRAAERFHDGIPRRLVTAFDWSLLAFETAARRRFTGWARTMARNDWFQARVVRTLQDIERRYPNQAFTLFSYSYTARLPFEFAKRAGWSTVLGQIDPGPSEEKIVLDLHEKAGVADRGFQAPEEYWRLWRRECELADRIVVNSEWSASGLAAAGAVTESLAATKLRVLPLIFEPPPAAAGFVRVYPEKFTPSRPLRVLFLGQVNLRKGTSELLRAVPLLAGRPVEFWMVGPQLLPRETYAPHPQVKWFGVVPRGTAMQYYRDADVFLFPTYSDGFGLTQLEAQAWRLPVIASRHCGDVVRDGENGALLPEIHAAAIALVLEDLLAHPERLRHWAQNSHLPAFDAAHLAGGLMEREKDGKPCSTR